MFLTGLCKSVGLTAKVLKLLNHSLEIGLKIWLLNTLLERTFICKLSLQIYSLSRLHLDDCLSQWAVGNSSIVKNFETTHRKSRKCNENESQENRRVQMFVSLQFDLYTYFKIKHKTTKYFCRSDVINSCYYHVTRFKDVLQTLHIWLHVSLFPFSIK